MSKNYIWQFRKSVQNKNTVYAVSQRM